MKFFKKFFGGISKFIKKIGNSREWEIFVFTYDSIKSCVDFHEALTDFLDQMKLVVASLAIVGKYILKGIRSFGKKTSNTITSTAM